MDKIYSLPWNSHLCRLPGQNHWLLLRVLLHTLSRFCHLLHWSSHFSEGNLLRTQTLTHGVYSVCNFLRSHAPTSATSKFPNSLCRFIWAEITGIDQFQTCSWDKTTYMDMHNWEQFFYGKRLNLSLRRENLAPWTGWEYPCVPQRGRGSYIFICSLAPCSFWSLCHDSPIIPSLIKYLIKICAF